MVLKHYYDIGVAVSASEGLVVPVLRDADEMSFPAIELAIREVRPQRRFDPREIGPAIQLTSANRNDSALARNLLVTVAMVERGQQLAHRKVASAAKDNEVELVDR